jgi:arylsulfatase A-like enzyme
MTFWRDRYADQVEALDCGIELLWESLAASGTLDRTLLIVTGCRGFPLGEHGNLGLSDPSLFEELVHVPLLIRRSDREGAGQRPRQLVVTQHLAGTIAEALGIEDGRAASSFAASILPLMGGDSAGWADAICLHNQNGERAIRTADWYLRLAPSIVADAASRAGACSVAELYSKPDDRWDVNEISGLCEDVVADLRERLAEWGASALRRPSG